MENPLVLSVIAKGTSDHPRYLLTNQNHQFWTGFRWAEEESDGLLFADLQDVGLVSQGMLVQQLGDKPVFRFSAPLLIDIRADDRPELADVQAWLLRAVRLLVDYRQHGTGPVPDSVAIVMLDCSSVKEIQK